MDVVYFLLLFLNNFWRVFLSFHFFISFISLLNKQKRVRKNWNSFFFPPLRGEGLQLYKYLTKNPYTTSNILPTTFYLAFVFGLNFLKHTPHFSHISFTFSCHLSSRLHSSRLHISLVCFLRGKTHVILILLGVA